MGFDGVLGDEELGGDLAVAESAGDESEDFEFASGDAEGLQGGWVGGERFAGFHKNGDFFHHDGFTDDFAIAGDAQAEPDAERREEYGDEGTVEFKRVLDDDEAVLDELQGDDKEAADETEDEDVALHDGVGEKYTRG